ncbi:DNA-directed DNA polymerase eta rad30 [Mortierella sp. GBA43]|nr:DNA-directed DNA polymerase eta rad30 [Mortierella sp. GBA43]
MATSAPRAQVPEVLKRQKCFIHIDLEQIRLGLTPDVPLVSQQWNAIIAVNYAARKYGITRLHHNVFDAKQLCPELVCAHVATLGPGDSQPDYYPSPSRYTHKVSLDPYRKASVKIFTVFRRFCAQYQKGGLDEVFMDVTDIVNQRIMERYGNDLSKWDPDSAEMIDWKKDYPDMGVVFGMPQDGDTHGSSSGVGLLDDDDEDDGDGLIDGIKIEEERDKMDSDNEGDELDLDSENHHEAKIEPAVDDFLDLEQVLGDFDDSFSISQSNEDPNNEDEPLDITEKNASNNQESDPTPASEEISEEDRLRMELEQLLPYYGVPEGSFEERFWAEMQLLVAAEFCKEVRLAVRDELGYTCSAGIANNRLLAKVGSGMNKPFQQTIVLPKFIPNLLHGLKISKIRNLGGKFGKQVREDFSVERASQLWPIPLRRLQQRYGEQAGLELWQWCRGIDHGGVRKIKSKSMCSHKSFIPALSDLEELQFWITSMCLELESRMQSEFAETKRWPRTIALGFFGGRKAWLDQQEQELSATFRAPHKGSRSMPLGTRFEYGGVEGMAQKMYATLEKLIKEAETGGGRPILPLVLLTVTVSNFSEGHESALGDITKFFTKAPVQTQQTQQTQEEPNERTTVQNEGLSEVNCSGQNPSSSTIETGRQLVKPPETKEMSARRRFFQPRVTEQRKDDPSTDTIQHQRFESDMGSAAISHPSSPAPQDLPETTATTMFCDQCPSPGKQIPIEDWEQHADYHFALQLLEDEKKQLQAERQQQAIAAGGGRIQETNAGAKRSSPSNSSASSNRGKRKKTTSMASSSGSTSSSTPNTVSLSKFFKPSTS